MTVEEYLNFVFELKSCKLNRKEHIAEIEEGMPVVEASINVLSLQAELADVIGSISEDVFISPSVSALSEGISMWLGTDFQYHYTDDLHLCQMFFKFFVFFCGIFTFMLSPTVHRLQHRRNKS